MVIRIISYVLYAFVICLWIGAIISWFPVEPGGLMSRVARIVNGITEPVLRPLRRVLPPVRAGGGALDLSPLVLTIAILLLLRLI